MSEQRCGPGQQQPCPEPPLSAPVLDVSPRGAVCSSGKMAPAKQDRAWARSRTPRWHMVLVAGLREKSSQQTSKDQFSALQTIPAAFGLFSGIPV